MRDHVHGLIVILLNEDIVAKGYADALRVGVGLEEQMKVLL